MVPATAVVDAHLARIAEVNPAVNAATVVLADRAREAAAALDARIARGEEPGRSPGVPISVKENIDLTWSATTSGLPFAPRHVPPANATFVQQAARRPARSRSAAATCPTSACAGTPTTTCSAARSTRGTPTGCRAAPAAATRSRGHRHGGRRARQRLRRIAAAARARGRDRRAASVGRPGARAGREPSAARVVAAGVRGQRPARPSVADLDLLFAVMHGADDVDPVSVTVPHPSSYDGPRRAAVMVDPCGWGVSTRGRRGGPGGGLGAVGRRLGGRGGRAAGDRPVRHAVAAALGHRDGAGAADARGLPGTAVGRHGAVLRRQLAGVELLDTGAAYGGAWAERHALAAQWRQFHSRYPVVLGPVTTEAMPPIGFDLSGPEAATEQWRQHRLLVTANFLGLPAVAVPTGVDGGRPQGVQVIAALHQDHVALAAARDIEAALGVLTPIDPRP